MPKKKRKMPFIPIMFEPYAFSSILVSAIEVYNRESLGFLIGHPDRQFVGGKMTDCLSIRACYPMQSADRGRNGVGFGNLAARVRAIGTVRAVGFELVGGFHSHSDFPPYMSDEDVDVIHEELVKDYSKMGLKQWLEIVVSVHKITKTETIERLRRSLLRRNKSELGFRPRNDKYWIDGDLLVGPKLAYRVRVAGYVFDEKGWYEVLLCYSRY